MSQQSFMGAEDIDYINQQRFESPLQNNSTDVIISSYENKISQNIAAKTLSASRRGKSPEFTKEELLYLNKKSGEDEDTELKVITPAPVITLKKGKTELNIKNASTLVQKMEEKYPTGGGKQLDELAIEQANRSWKQATVYNDKNEVTEVITNPDYVTPQALAADEPLRIPGGFEQPIKTVNKNAYEIREAVLSHALNWVQYSHDIQSPPKKSPTEDDVLNVAQKFYKFVENRR